MTLTTFKLEGKVTSLSGSSQGEVEDNREKWGDFWGKLMVINRNIVLFWKLPYPNLVNSLKAVQSDFFFFIHNCLKDIYSVSNIYFCLRTLTIGVLHT